MTDLPIDRVLVGDRAAFADVFAALAPFERSDQPELLDLVARHAAGGNAPALELLLTAVDDYGLDRSAIRRVLVDDSDLDDVRQDVLVAIATSITKFAGTAKFTTWLHSVARNTAVAHFRRQATRGHVVTDTSGPAQTPIDPQRLDQLGPAERVSSIIATRESVRAAIETLPEIYRDALTMRDVDGHDYEHLVAELGIGLSAAKSRVARARAMLASELRLDLEPA